MLFCYRAKFHTFVSRKIVAAAVRGGLAGAQDLGRTPHAEGAPLHTALSSEVTHAAALAHKPFTFLN